MPLKFSIAAALALFFTANPAAAEFSIESESERSSLQTEIRSYLLENPEIILEALQIWEQRQQFVKKQAQAFVVEQYYDEIFFDDDSWVGGSLDGSATIVEFIDYNCGYCRRAHDDVQRLISDDGDIRFVVKEYPILGQDSELAAQFAIAVRRLYGDEAYRSVHEALITLEGAADILALESLVDELNLDIEGLEAEMLSDKVTSVIETNRSLAFALGINGTPGFVIGKSVLQGMQPYEVMQDTVAAWRSAN